MTHCYRWKNDALILNIHLQPNAKTNEIVGRHGDYLKIRIKAPAVDNQANAALLKFIAQIFETSLSDIKLLTGKTSRYKCVAIKNPKNNTALTKLIPHK